jgi:hypothetical protein
VTCPYVEPKCDSSVAPGERRCQCGRVLTRCSSCGASNRAFANFCRSCGERLPVSSSNWTGFRGSSRRLGFNPHDPGPDPVIAKIPLALHLGNECRALLAYDSHLVAVSHSGVVEIADVVAKRSVCRFQALGPVTAQPCIRDGVLYLAAAAQLSAYSLGALTHAQPRVHALWTIPLGGTPIHALTPVGDGLYVTVASPSWREIRVIENLAHPAAPRRIHGATRTSWLAADARNAYAVFLSQNDGEAMYLHVAGEELTTRAVSLQPVPEHPIAIIGGTLFGIFGQSHRLYRIDVATGGVEEALDEDTQFFALSTEDDEWDRDPVVIDSSGVLFSRTGVRDAFGPHDRAIKGSPLIVRNSAVVIGMEDGRVRVYNLAQLPRHETWLVGGGSAAITALASFDNYIAAGNRDGVVEVRELRARNGAAA